MIKYIKEILRNSVRKPIYQNIGLITLKWSYFNYFFVNEKVPLEEIIRIETMVGEVIHSNHHLLRRLRFANDTDVETLGAASYYEL
jgi:hypothetical protein